MRCLLSGIAAAMLVMACLSVSAGEDVVFGNGKTGVTESDIHFYERDRIPPEKRGEYFAGPDAVRHLAENLFVIRALAEEADQSGTLDRELIDWQVELYRKRLMMEQYLDALQSEKLEAADWEAVAREAYLAEPEAFMAPEQVRASHILITTAQHTEEEARALAADIREQLDAGAKFADLVEQYSEDEASKKKQGSLGTFARGRMVKPFEDAVFALREPGELAGPVKSQFGYHIIRLDEYLPAKTKDFSEVKDEIIKSRKQAASRQVREAELIDARSDPDIEIDEEKLEQLRQDFLGEIQN